MRTVSWMWFWYFLFGFISGGSVVSIWTFLKKKAITFCWYEWILSTVAFLFLILMVQTFVASLYEGEVRAAWMSIVFLGVPMLIFIVVTFRSVQSKSK